MGCHARQGLLGLGLGWIRLCFAAASVQAAEISLPVGEVVTREGQVEYGAARRDWEPAKIGQSLSHGDRVRTHALSRATLRLEELGIKRIGERTTFEILPPREPGGRATIDLKAGALYLFMRGRPREFEVRTPHAVGTSRGTDFHVQVEEDGRSHFTVFDGEVEMSNALGAVELRTGEQGLAEVGQPPRKTAVIETIRLVQWWLYYPAVLDPDEISLSVDEERALAESLAAYRRGDVLRALEGYPEGREPASDGDHVYYAGLLLAAGQVREALARLNKPTTFLSQARAVRVMIAAVTKEGETPQESPGTASGWLAESYRRQADYDLKGALAAAQEATRHSTNFGFAWIRIAELEFSHGRTRRAKAALARGLEVCPGNAQAWAMQGFILSAENRIKEAVAAFEHAMSLDGNLANAWFGRGLCRIRKGDDTGGRRDLQVAAALEPNRALLRSYLGKAFANNQDAARAAKELALAERLDPADPTPWFYQSLLAQQQHRINQAVADLEQSAALNENRQVYRSRLLLDQDRAVRSANLASIYQAAGMTNVSVGEAARAVNHDYGNYSAHLFLARSFNALRDPTRFNLRYEAVWLNELLLANLLAPVGAGSLSQNINQQEYSKLFEADRLNFSSDTLWRSDGQLQERASQFGTFGNTSYALDLDFQSNDGYRPNNELSRIEWYTRIKQQLTPQDSVMLLTEYTDFEAGDNFQYYDWRQRYHPEFSTSSKQEPNAVVGYHREWAPGVHTLLLGGRLENLQEVSVGSNRVGVVITWPNLVPQAITSWPFDIEYQNEFETYIGEVNQIFATDRQTLVVGGRFHKGEFHTENLFTENANTRRPVCYDLNVQPTNCFLDPPAYANVTDDYKRISAYGYYTLEVLPRLRVTGGVAYDYMIYPVNYRVPPVFEGEGQIEEWSPKAAVVWDPSPHFTLRGAYARSVGGVSFDESFRLEPAQLAGFVQSFRTIIPESVAGSVTAPLHQTLGAAIDVKLPSHTYLNGWIQNLNADFDREGGVLYFVNVTPPIYPWRITEELDFSETTVGGSMHQLISREWAVGVQYVYSRADLDRDYPVIPTYLGTAPQTFQRSELQRATVFGLYNHPSGFFAGAEGNWFYQRGELQHANARRQPLEERLPGDEFYQLNVYVGWRLPWQAGDITVGMLNVTDQDYHLDPLNIQPDLPRERTFMTRFRFQF